MFNICLTDFVSTDSCSEKGCKTSPKGTNEKTHNTCTQGINLRLNDRSMKSIMHEKIQITSVISHLMYFLSFEAFTFSLKSNIIFYLFN